MMIDTSEEIVSGGIVRGGIVICDLVAIVADQIRPPRQAKLNRLAKRVIDPVLKSFQSIASSVLDALERVACYRTQSREPLISDRKNIDRVEMIGAHVLRADIGFEIRLRLVSGVNAGVKGKPRRKVMRKRQSNVPVLIVRAHIEKLGKASDTNQTELCPLRGRT